MRLTMGSVLDELTGVSGEILNHVEYRLEEWAKWQRKEEKEKLDHSTTSPVYRMMKYGCIPAEKPGPKPSPVNESADEMELIIKVLATQHPAERYAEALREFYLYNKKDTQGNAARRMGVSRQIFRGYLKGACIWLTGWFTKELTNCLLKKKEREPISNNIH